MLVVNRLLVRKVNYYGERPLFNYRFNISKYLSLESISESKCFPTESTNLKSFCSDTDDTSMVASSHNTTRRYMGLSIHINFSDFIEMFVPGQEIE